jgi:molybdopterin-guanine dinucleotide biosynthesis protein A
VSSVDVPLLHPAFVRSLFASLDDDADVAVPAVEGRLQPLGAAYRVSVRNLVEELLAEDRLAMGALLDRCRVRILTEGELPHPRSLNNLNDRRAYEQALALPPPDVSVDGVLRRAWTLGEVLRGRTAPLLNGEPVEPDPELPLVAGDVLVIT